MSFEISLVCSECGEALDISRTEKEIGEIVLRVVPCDTCIEEAHCTGYDEAKEEYQEEE